MSKFRFNTILVLTAAMTLGVAAPSFAQEGKLIGVLKSNAGQKEKADACRELARTGTKQAVPVLAALLDGLRQIARADRGQPCGYAPLHDHRSRR